MKISQGSTLFKKVYRGSNRIKAVVCGDKLFYPEAIMFSQSAIMDMETSTTMETVNIDEISIPTFQMLIHKTTESFTFNSKIVNQLDPDGNNDLIVILQALLVIRKTNGDLVYQTRIHDDQIYVKPNGLSYFMRLSKVEKLRERVLSPIGTLQPSVVIGIDFEPSKYTIESGLKAIFSIVAYQRELMDTTQIVIRSPGVNQTASVTIPYGSLIQFISVMFTTDSDTYPSTVTITGATTSVAVSGKNGETKSVEPSDVKVNELLTMTMQENVYAGIVDGPNQEAVIFIEYITP